MKLLESRFVSRLWSRLAAVVLLSALVGCGSSDGDGADGLQARLQNAVNRVLATRTIPGASVAVVVDGHLSRVVAGLADVDAGRKVVVDDEFRVASVTKNYIAALAVDLASDGIVGLDDTVGQWLPDLPASLVRVRDVTLRQLLSHTSGLAQTFTADRDRGRVLSSDDVLARIPPSACDPGRCWNYADGNYVLAGLILEAATGTSIPSAINERFLNPLGLTHTHFISEHRADVVPQYVVVSDKTGKPIIPRRLRRQLLPILTKDAAGGMQASASDLAQWGDALFRARATTSGALHTLLDSSAMRDLRCPNQCPLPYGLGVFHYKLSGDELVGHDGSSGAILAHDLERATTIAIVTNGGEQDTSLFLKAIFDALKQPR